MIIAIDVSLDLYRIFCVVVRTENMSLAAKELYISQPAVSMAIRQLEDKFKKPLLIRSSRGIRPTVEGKMLYEYLVQAMSLIQTAESKYFQMASLNEGEIKIGASDTILSNFLLPYINLFLKKYPNITIKITNNLTRDTINLLKVGQVELGFVNLPIEEGDPFVLRECMQLNDCLLSGKKYSGLAETGLNIKQLNEYPLLLLEKASSTRRFLDSFSETYGTILQPAIELGSTDLLLKFAQIDLGLTFAAKEFVQEELDKGLLFEIPLSPKIPPRSIGLIRLGGIPLSYAADKFIEIVTEGTNETNGTK